MSARDIYHRHVRKALTNDDWKITSDPLRLQWGTKDMYVDLGAEKLVAAEKEGRKIAVEIKSFIGPSEIEDLKNALGQFVLYRNVLEETEPQRKLYLAIREATYVELFEEPIGRLLIEKENVRLLVFDPVRKVIVQWIE
ncbi:fatty-acid synthase [Chloroflexi bacterium TSY]|nr:fatty-acid synthase [Chloroflexi bacterium TSY]